MRFWEMEGIADFMLEEVGKVSKPELGILYAGGGLLLIEPSEHVTREQIIKMGRRNGGKVFERRVFVTEQWKEVTE